MENTDKKCCIYTFYYKPQSLIDLPENYVSVWAGKNHKSGIKGFTGDDTGDNISDKNRYFSELSGIYWVWKNTHSEIVGTCHYRRYFTSFKEPFFSLLKRNLYFVLGLWKKRYGLIYTQNFKYWIPKILSEKDAVELLNKYDAIMPVRRKLRNSIKTHYKKYHHQKDLDLLKDILNEYSPEYLNSFESLLNQNRLFANNMFVMHWETFDKMMKWLFFILFKFEERSNIKNYTGYQERILGFLSERLISLWILHNKINYKELDLIYFKKLKYK